MRTRTWLIVSAIPLVAAIIVLSAGDHEDQAIVDQLARRQAETSPAASLGPTPERFQPQMFQLTDQLVAEWEEEESAWVVKQDDSSVFLVLPFPPDHSGALPRQPDDRDDAKTSSNPGYVGADACDSCHQEKHDSFVFTAHHNTSGVLDVQQARGEFSPPQNLLSSRNPNLSFQMRQRNDRCFERLTWADWTLELPRDVFTGSAKAGQSYLYWHNNQLFQTYVSYLSHFDEWIASPGYGDTMIDYRRPIRLECLECHMTFIQQRHKPNAYDRQSAIWGISCERCHGPGKDHVEFHQDHPEESVGRHIMDPSELTRTQQIDICGQCHSGSFSLVRDAFSYRPGEDLDQHHKLHAPDFDGVGGIHTANQLTRLRKSRCYQNSDMTCTSCHDPHQNERGNTRIFSDRCLDCHEVEHCGMSEQVGASIADNCIDCHMPEGENEGMTLQVSEGNFTVRMLDHYIRVDHLATKAYLNR